MLITRENPDVISKKYTRTILEFIRIVKSKETFKTVMLKKTTTTTTVIFYLKQLFDFTSDFLSFGQARAIL